MDIYLVEWASLPVVDEEQQRMLTLQGCLFLQAGKDACSTRKLFVPKHFIV
jgi:hypothetical protein